MEFTIAYNENNPQTRDYRITFTNDRFTTLKDANVQRLHDYVRAWDNDAPIFGWSIRSVEAIDGSSSIL